MRRQATLYLFLNYLLVTVCLIDAMGMMEEGISNEQAVNAFSTDQIILLLNKNYYNLKPTSYFEYPNEVKNLVTYVLANADDWYQESFVNQYSNESLAKIMETLNIVWEITPIYADDTFAAQRFVTYKQKLHKLAYSKMSRMQQLTEKADIEYVITHNIGSATTQALAADCYNYVNQVPAIDSPIEARMVAHALPMLPLSMSTTFLSGTTTQPLIPVVVDALRNCAIEATYEYYDALQQDPEKVPEAFWQKILNLDTIDAEHMVRNLAAAARYANPDINFPRLVSAAYSNWLSKASQIELEKEQQALTSGLFNVKNLLEQSEQQQWAVIPGFRFFAEREQAYTTGNLYPSIHDCISVQKLKDFKDFIKSAQCQVSFYLEKNVYKTF